MKNFYIPIIVSLGLSLSLSAQEKSPKELRGDKYVFNYSYDKAINMYTEASPLTPEGQRNLAVSYHKMGKDLQADSVYSTYLYKNSTVSEDFYNYAQVLKNNGKQEESNKWMEKFSAAKPDDLRAKDYQAHKSEWAAMNADNGKYLIQHQNMNTSSEDFGTAFYNGKIVFTSSRGGSVFSKEDNWHRQPFLDMYVAELENGQLKNPVNFDKDLNGKMHDGPASFSKDGNFMAFTKNHYHDKSKDRVVELQLFFSTKKDGKWTVPVPFIQNDPSYSIGQPSLSGDGHTMYFTSDMPGGLGGSDIYMITSDANGVWGKSINLGNAVNTEGDEMFPFYEENSKTLFYSSDGRFGLGGLDIFTSSLSSGTPAASFNAGSPMNSKYDDFAAIADDKMSKGFFSSDRTGGSGSDDIYSFDFLTKPTGKKIEGIAKETNGNPIGQSYVSLFNDHDSLLNTITTRSDGAYTFMVDGNRNYKLIGKKELYSEGSNTASTFGTDSIVKADVVLTKKEIVKQQAPAPIAKAEILNSIYYDLDKSNIRTDAKTELDKIVKVMNDNPDMVLVLSSHTDCRATKEYNQKLSDRREKTSSNYIKKRITKPSRISGKGYGETELVNSCACEGKVVSNCTEAEFQKDRKTDFVIVNKGQVAAK